MAKHTDLTDAHVPYRWSYADQSTREAASGFAAGDVGKLALQEDTDTLWMLTATTPTWKEIGSGSGGDSTFTAAYASRPAAGNDGDIFLPSDGFTLQRDTGAAWVPWGPLYKFTEPPAVADFTWENQGTASATKTKGGIYITDTTDSNVNRILYKSAPSAPFTVTMGFLINSLGITNESGGMLLRQSSDGKLVTFGDLVNTGQKIAITKWGNYSTWVGAYKESAVNLAICYASPLFLRYYDDGATNRVFSISRDGQNFLPFLTQSRTDYLTIDQIGVFIGMNGSGSSVGITLLHWGVT